MQRPFGLDRLRAALLLLAAAAVLLRAFVPAGFMLDRDATDGLRVTLCSGHGPQMSDSATAALAGHGRDATSADASHHAHHAHHANHAPQAGSDASGHPAPTPASAGEPVCPFAAGSGLALLALPVLPAVAPSIALARTWTPGDAHHVAPDAAPRAARAPPLRFG